MLTQKAYAKINLALDVLHKRADGYHEVNMIMQTIDLADTIRIKKANKLTVQTIGADLPNDERNIAYKAALMMADYAKLQPDVSITIEKKIPLAAGLAGGSADAGAVMRGLNELWNLNLDFLKLENLAASLGSDVPFCIRGGTAQATGRGEKIKYLKDCPKLNLVIVNPFFEVSTKWVYDNYARAKLGDAANIADMIKAIEHSDKDFICTNLYNALESVTIKEYSIIKQIKDVMMNFGVRGCLMSGSGPTVFAVVDDEICANAVLNHIKQSINVRAWLAKTRRANYDE